MEIKNPLDKSYGMTAPFTSLKKPKGLVPTILYKMGIMRTASFILLMKISTMNKIIISKILSYFRLPREFWKLVLLVFGMKSFINNILWMAMWTLQKLATWNDMKGECTI